MIATILITVSTLLGYLTAYFLDKKKHTVAFRVIVGTMGVITLSIIWVNHFDQEKKFKDTGQKLGKITGQNDSLKIQINKVHDQNDSLAAQVGELTQKIEPFLQMARSSYPALRDEEALTKLATEISKMQPKLIFLGQTEPRRDSTTNLIQTVYVFRSKPTTALRDVEIRIKFDGRFVSITGRRTGAIGIGQEQMIPDQDSTGFYYATGYLHETNDIKIEVISKNMLKILSMSLRPSPDK